MSIISYQIKRTVTIACIVVPFSFLMHAYAAAQDSPRAVQVNTVSVALLRTPVKARKHFEKAREAAVAGRESDYERELAVALAIDPAFSEAYLLRASHEVTLGRYAAAIEDAQTAQRIEPGIAWADIVHGSACNGLRHYDEAFAVLDALRSAEAATWQAIYETTRATVGRGDSKAALDWSALLLENVPAARLDDATLLRADALQLAHRWSEAVAQLDRYLASPGPQLARAQVLLVRDHAQQLAREDGSAEIVGVASR